MHQQDPAPAQDPPPTQVDEIVVVGRPLTQAQSDKFVRSVAAPVEDRGVATWRTPVCVGVANLQQTPAQAMADRILDWAASLDLRIANTGCEPNIFVIFADDGDTAARDVVASRRHQFATGVAGADLGIAALDRFQSSGKPIRWWHVSLPTDPDTGQPIRRLSGVGPMDWQLRELTRPSDFGVNQSHIMGSRLSQDLRDDLQQVVVIVDISALDRASFSQITDYVAFVALAQVNPDIDAEGLDSILGVFSNRDRAPQTLSDWDRAYLNSLYSTEQTSTNPAANRDEISRLMVEWLNRQSQSH